MAHHRQQSHHYSNASRSVGPIIEIDKAQFEELVGNNQQLLVISAYGGFFSTHYRAMIFHRGFYFFCKSSDAFNFPKSVDVLFVEKLAIPKTGWFDHGWDY